MSRKCGILRNASPRILNSDLRRPAVDSSGRSGKLAIDAEIDLQRFTMLSPFGRRLEELALAPDLVAAIKEFHRHSSTVHDLHDAKDCLETIDKQDRSAASYNIIARSLLTNAIMCYCRATHSKSRARPLTGATKRFSTQQRQLHDDIVDIRDKVIAHAEIPAGRLAPGLLEETVALHFEDDASFSLSFPTRAATLAKGPREIIANLVDTAIITGVAKRNVARDSLAEVLTRYLSDPQIGQISREFHVTAGQFYATDEETGAHVFNNPRYRDTASSAVTDGSD